MSDYRQQQEQDEQQQQQQPTPPTTVKVAMKETHHEPQNLAVVSVLDFRVFRDAVNP